MDLSDFKSALERVRSKIPDEVLSTVSSDLKALESGFLEKSDSAKVATAEAVERKKLLRAKDEELENLVIDRDSWKTKFESYDDSGIKEERDRYKTKYDSFLTSQKDGFVSYFEQASKTDAWAKVKDEYKVPEEKDGKPAWDTLKPEELENNITKMTYHQKLGLFESTHKPEPNTGKKFIDGKPVLTAAEYMQIRSQYGVESREAKEAMAQVKR
jgi:hypothetical protein